MKSNADVGRALKIILQRLKEVNERDAYTLPKTVLNHCGNCKFIHRVEYYDQQWGRFFIGHNWCDLDKNLMDTGEYNLKRGKGHEFVNNCPYFEAGQGKYDEITNKEKYPH